MIAVSICSEPQQRGEGAPNRGMNTSVLEIHMVYRKGRVFFWRLVAYHFTEVTRRLAFQVLHREQVDANCRKSQERSNFCIGTHHLCANYVYWRALGWAFARCVS